MRAHALLVGAIEQDLAAAELPPLAWHDVLAALDAAPEGRMRIHELADAIVFSRSGLSRLLDRLEREELLRRERSSNDRRGAYAVLTPAGRDVLDQMSAVYRRTVERALRPAPRRRGGRAQGIAGARLRLRARGVPGRG